VIPPAALIFVPFGIMALGLPPLRPGVMLGGVVLGGLTFIGGQGPLWFAEHGWTLVLGAWFLCATVLVPAAGFLPRALAAVAGALASVALLLAPLPDGLRRLDGLVRQRVRGAAVDVASAWSPEGLGRFGEAMSGAAVRAAELQAELYPAMLALGSLSALGVAYWAWARLAVRDPQPLAPFRSFDFPDVLVWVLIASLVLVVAPLEPGLDRLGWNGALFMAALYALRGAAVLGTVAPRPGMAGRVVLALLIVLLYPVAVGTAMMVGLTDTWIDLRARHARAESET
jgi:hypothetical protein